MLGDVKNVHFVGIGGVGMSGLAQVLLSRGYSVSGSDARGNSYTERLEGMGAKIYMGHSPDHVRSAELVVYSSAIPEGNPELRHASEKGIPCRHRGSLLAELVKKSRGIAVTGSHGKTTTASMLSALMLKAGLDPTVVVGGSQAFIGGNAHAGGGRYFICEADESDGSFLELAPPFAVITNIEDDHSEHYGGFEGLKDAFGRFASGVFDRGGVVAFSDHRLNMEVLGGLNPDQSIVYGLGETCQVKAEEYSDTFGASSFQVRAAGRRLGIIELPVPGIYNVYNALGAISMALYLGVGFERIKESFAGFQGVERRFQIMGEAGGVLVIEDYAHHPGELFSVLASAKRSGRRVISVFQPHRYTRTRQLLKDLGASLSSSDIVMVTDIYSAGEKPLGGISSAEIVSCMKAYGHPSAHYVPDKDDIPGEVARIAAGGDLVLIMGAGNINEITGALMEKLKG